MWFNVLLYSVVHGLDDRMGGRFFLPGLGRFQKSPGDLSIDSNLQTNLNLLV